MEDIKNLEDYNLRVDFENLRKKERLRKSLSYVDMLVLASLLREYYSKSRGKDFINPKKISNFLEKFQFVPEDIRGTTSEIEEYVEKYFNELENYNLVKKIKRGNTIDYKLLDNVHKFIIRNYEELKRSSEIEESFFNEFVDYCKFIDKVDRFRITSREYSRKHMKAKLKLK
jgi:hypothetical protein